jgi:hypothetical protein
MFARSLLGQCGAKAAFGVKDARAHPPAALEPSTYPGLSADRDSPKGSNTSGRTPLGGGGAIPTVQQAQPRRADLSSVRLRRVQSHVRPASTPRFEVIDCTLGIVPCSSAPASRARTFDLSRLAFGVKARGRIELSVCLRPGEKKVSCDTLRG